MTAPADPELLLAAACCRWPPSPARDAVVRAAATGVDWPRFGRVVIRQRIGGMVEAALRKAQIVAPPPVADLIARQAMRIARRSILSAAETVRVVAAIEQAGYPVVAVKGAVLGAMAYRMVALKHSKDIDLLILPEHLEPVMALLETLGFRLFHPAEQLDPGQRRMLTRYGKDVTMLRQEAGRSLQVELHWRLFDNPCLLPGVTARSPTQRIALTDGMTVPTLADPDLYAYLALHGAVDGWSRMKWLADLHALLVGRDADAVRALHEGAVVRGGGAASAQAMVMMHELFGLPLAPDFTAALIATPRVRTLIAGAYRLMAVHDGATEIGTWRGGQMLALGMQMLLGTGPRYHWNIVRSILYTQSDMYRSALPPGWYVLYPAVRIPAWIARSCARVIGRAVGRGASTTIATKS